MRYLLFFGINILIMTMITVVLSIFGLNTYITQYGIDYTSLMIMCLFWGVGGSFISLLFSKKMAKMFMGVEVVGPSSDYSYLVNKIHELCKKAQIEKMPEVGVYKSDEPNAFATGPSKNNSLIAVSTGLLDKMNEHEIEGVLGHEVAHIANGDMVTMTLVQGIINAFVMFFARIAAFFVSQLLRGDDDEGEGLGPIAYMLTVVAFQILFGILGSIVVAWFSRHREYKADAGSAMLSGKQNMILALESLRKNYDQLEASDKSMAAFQISSKSSFLELFSTHPSLEKRIESLKKL